MDLLDRLVIVRTVTYGLTEMIQVGMLISPHDSPQFNRPAFVVNCGVDFLRPDSSDQGSG